MKETIAFLVRTHTVVLFFLTACISISIFRAVIFTLFFFSEKRFR